MSQEFYKEKYLKYKNKYMSLKGGLNADIEWQKYKPFLDYYKKNGMKLQTGKPFQDGQPMYIFNIKDLMSYLLYLKQRGIPSEKEFTTYITEYKIIDWKEQLEKYNIVVTINPYSFIVLPNPPEIIIPSSIIRFDTFSDDNDYLNIYKYYAGYGESEKKVTYEINVTHYLLDFRSESSEKSFIGMYYHNPSEADLINKKKIIDALREQFQLKINYFSKPGFEESKKEYEDKISKIESEEFWNESRYFKINELRFTLQSLPSPNTYKYKLEIKNLNSVLSTRGGGKTLVCLFFYLFFHNKGKLQATEIELDAGSTSVVNKFYKPKLGMNCTGLKCVSDISKIISKCEFPSDIKLILQYNDTFIGDLDTMINMMQ
jgi:hypothetical protein